MDVLPVGAGERRHRGLQQRRHHHPYQRLRRASQCELDDSHRAIDHYDRGERDARRTVRDGGRDEIHRAVGYGRALRPDNRLDRQRNQLGRRGRHAGSGRRERGEVGHSRSGRRQHWPPCGAHPDGDQHRFRVPIGKRHRCLLGGRHNQPVPELGRGDRHVQAPSVPVQRSVHAAQL